MAGLTFFGFIGISYFFPIIGLVPIFMLVSSGYLLRFFLSHYLNRIIDSSRRATVLSFKGLSFNLAYGFFGVLFAFLLRFLRSRVVEKLKSIGFKYVSLDLQGFRSGAMNEALSEDEKIAKD